MSTVSITYLFNAGILLQFGDTRLLVDAPYTGTSVSSPMPQEVVDYILAPGGVPDGIQHLLFTHLHTDHFAPRQTYAFLQANPDVHVVFPLPPEEGPLREKAGGHTGWLPNYYIANSGMAWQWMQEHHIAAEAMDFPIGQLRQYDLAGGVRLTAFNTGHMGEVLDELSNYCLLFEYEDKAVLVTGDSNYAAPVFQYVLAGKTLDAALVNPLFLRSRAGKAIIQDILRPKTLVLYHIPAYVDDSSGIRRLATLEASRWPDERLLPMVEPFQTLTL